MSMNSQETQKIRKPYGVRYAKSVVSCDGDRVLTEQAHKERSDVNFIVNRVRRDQLADVQRMAPEMFGTFAAVDLHEAMNMITQAQQTFMELPADIRAKFGNSPEAFMDFVNDEKNVPEMRDLKLINPDYETAAEIAAREEREAAAIAAAEASATQ